MLYVPAVSTFRKNINLSFVTTESQLKFSDFSGKTFKDFEVLYFSMSANDDTAASQRLVLQTAL